MSVLNRYNLDYETRSSIDIKRAGAYRYADDPSTDITLVAISKNREPVRLWDRFASDKENAPALEWLCEAASDPEAIISCFNVGFEVAITTYHWERTFGFKPPLITQWRCSQALCRTAAIPQSLEAAAEFLKLPFQKNKIGSALIQKFCVPQKDGTWIEPDYDKPITVGGEKMSAAKAWQLFREYAIRDVETERAMGERLKILELKGWMLEGFQLDLRMNMRGVPINLDAVRYAQQIVDEYNGKIASRFREITGLNASQTAKVLAWMQERGYPGDNMQVGTVTEVLTGEIVDEDGESTGEVKQPLWTAMTPEAVEALQLKSLIGYAALKKLPTMERTACSDGRVRGMFTWWGAIRTGRHTSKILQLQNCKRSTKLSEKCYNAIAQGGLDAQDVEMLFGPPPELIATCIRHFIDPGEAKEFIDVDFSQIEARVLPWLAGDTATLDAFRAGHDAYVIAASTALGVPMDQITKDQRQLGKVIVLACGFGGGLGAMTMACKTYGIKMTDKEKMKIVRDWRKANKPITDLWKAMQDGMVQAILNPGTWVQVNDKCRYGVDKKLGYRALILEIPSGRRLQYPYPEAKEVYKIKRRKAKTEPVDEIPVEGDEDAQMEWVDIPKSQAIGPDGELYKGVWKTYEVSYFGPPKGSQKWCRVRTHGGVGAENCLGYDTEVLTEDGWMGITEVGMRRVFDGVEFVRHSGLRSISKDTTIDFDGLEITPDHLVLTEKGWSPSSITDPNETYERCYKLLRESLRSLDSQTKSAQTQEQREAALGSRVPVWVDPENGFERHVEEPPLLQQAVPPLQGGANEEDSHARNVEAPGFCGLEEHDRPLPPSDTSSVEELWRERYQSLSGMAGQLRGVLGGHGADVSTEADSGQAGQRERLLQRELPVGNSQGELIEHQGQQHYRHSVGPDERNRCGEEGRDQLHDDPLQDCQRVDRFQSAVCGAEREQQVYDLVSCGPRSRFVVRGKKKIPLIVHNCTQATAGDFLTLGAVEAEKRGYGQVLTVHDQLITEYWPERGNTVDGLVDALCQLPSWAKDFPLNAVGNLANFYTKD